MSLRWCPDEGGHGWFSTYITARFGLVENSHFLESFFSLGELVFNLLLAIQTSLRKTYQVSVGV